MKRAIELSREHGMGRIALANTNHWMRGGSYGWQAAEAGAIGICWTNTLPNLPPWGASDPRVGNNPWLSRFRVSRGMWCWMAMSQFSYGTLTSYRMRGERLPLDGGFDVKGQLTRNPAAIEGSGRPFPIGFWKGSGLALMLDLLAALLSSGKATHQLATDPDRETMLSQVFIAIDPSFHAASADQAPLRPDVADQIVAHFQLPPHSAGEPVRYPGYRVLNTRRGNLANGAPMDPSIWQQVQAY